MITSSTMLLGGSFQARPVIDRFVLNKQIFQKAFCFSVMEQIKNIFWGAPQGVEILNSSKINVFYHIVTNPDKTKTKNISLAKPFKNRLLCGKFGECPKVVPHVKIYSVA